MMSGEQYSKIMEDLKQVRDGQGEYRKMHLANQEQNSAAECVSDSLHAQGRFFTDISEMISLIKVTVEDISKKGKENEKKLMTYSNTAEVTALFSSWLPWRSYWY